MKLENSQTIQNLINAFAGESQARNRYSFYAKVAKKEGFEQIAEIFSKTAENEHQHAKLFYKYIPNHENRKVTGSYPFFIGTTYENLLAAAKGEHEEWINIYKQSAEIADAEGFDEISNLFKGILDIEKRHHYRFEMLAKKVREDRIFKKEEITQWICRKCGHTQISKEAPCICPICEHPTAYFEVFMEKF